MCYSKEQSLLASESSKADPGSPRAAASPRASRKRPPSFQLLLSSFYCTLLAPEGLIQLAQLYKTAQTWL